MSIVTPLHQPSLYDDQKIDDFINGHLFHLYLMYCFLLFTDFLILGKMGIGLSWYVSEEPNIVQFFNDYVICLR